MVSGSLSLSISASNVDSGFIRIVNKSFNMGNGAAYLTKNPMPLVIT